MENSSVQNSLAKLKNALEFTRSVQEQIKGLRDNTNCGDANLNLPGLKRPDFVPPLSLKPHVVASDFDSARVTTGRHPVDGGTASGSIDDGVIDQKIDRIKTSIAKVEELLKNRNVIPSAPSTSARDADAFPGLQPHSARADPPPSSAWFAPPGRTSAATTPQRGTGTPQRGSQTARTATTGRSPARSVALSVVPGDPLAYPPPTTTPDRPFHSLAKPKRTTDLELSARKPRIVEEREHNVHVLRQSLLSTRGINSYATGLAYGGSNLPDAKWSAAKKARLGLTAAWPDKRAAKLVPDLAFDLKRTTFPREPAHPLLATVDVINDPVGAKVAFDDHIKEINSAVDRLEERRQATWVRSFARRKDEGMLLPNKVSRNVRVGANRASVNGFARIMHVNAKFQRQPMLMRRSLRGRVLPWEARRSMIVEGARDAIPDEVKFTPTYKKGKAGRSAPKRLRKKGGKKGKKAANPPTDAVHAVPSSLPQDPTFGAHAAAVRVQIQPSGGPAVSMTGEELKHKLVAEFRRQLVDETQGLIDGETLRVLDRLETAWALDGAELHRPTVSLPRRDEHGNAIPAGASSSYFQGGAVIRPRYHRQARKLTLGKVTRTSQKLKARRDAKMLPDTNRELSLKAPLTESATTRRALKKKGLDAPERRRRKALEDAAGAEPPGPPLPPGAAVPPAVQRSGRADTWARMFNRVYAGEKARGPALPAMHLPVDRSPGKRDRESKPVRTTSAPLPPPSGADPATENWSASFNAMVDRQPELASLEENETVAPLRENMLARPSAVYGLHRIQSGEALEADEIIAPLDHARSMPVYDPSQDAPSRFGEPRLSAHTADQPRGARGSLGAGHSEGGPGSSFHQQGRESDPQHRSHPDAKSGLVARLRDAAESEGSMASGAAGIAYDSDEAFDFQTTHGTGLPPSGKVHRRSSSLWKMVKGAFSRRQSGVGDEMEHAASGAASVAPGGSRDASVHGGGAYEVGPRGLSRTSTGTQGFGLAQSQLDTSGDAVYPSPGLHRAPPVPLPSTQSGAMLDETVNMSMTASVPPALRMPDAADPIPEPHPKFPPAHHPAGSLRRGEMKAIGRPGPDAQSEYEALPPLAPTDLSPLRLERQTSGATNHSIEATSRSGTFMQSRGNTAKRGTLGSVQLPPPIDTSQAPGVAFGRTSRTQTHVGSPKTFSRANSTNQPAADAATAPLPGHAPGSTAPSADRPPRKVTPTEGSSTSTAKSGTKSAFVSCESLDMNKSRGQSISSVVGIPPVRTTLAAASIPTPNPSRRNSHVAHTGPPVAPVPKGGVSSLSQTSSRAPSQHQSNLSDSMDEMSYRRSSVRPPSRANSGVPPPPSPTPSRASRGSYVQTLRAKEASKVQSSKPTTPTGTLRGDMSRYATEGPAAEHAPGGAAALPVPSPEHVAANGGGTFRGLDSVAEERNQRGLSSTAGAHGTARHGVASMSPRPADVPLTTSGSRAQTVHFRQEPTSSTDPTGMMNSANPETTDAVRRQVLGLKSSSSLLKAAAFNAANEAASLHQTGEPSLAFPSGFDPLAGMDAHRANLPPLGASSASGPAPANANANTPAALTPNLPRVSSAHRRSNSRGSRAASPAQSNPGDKYKARIMKEDPLMVAESVGNVLGKLKEGASMYKHKVGSGGKGQTRMMVCDLTGDKVLLCYKSGFSTKKIVVRSVRVFVSGHASQRPIEITGADGKALQIQPNSVREYTIWSLGLNAALMLRDNQSQLQKGTNTSIWMLPWHPCVEVVDA